MHMKVVVTILLIAAMPVCAQAQNRSAGKVSKGNGVPSWDVTASCRAAAEVAYAGQAGEREKSCFESENRAREKLATDWSTQKLIERYGADMRLPDLREGIAPCRRQGQNA